MTLYFDCNVHLHYIQPEFQWILDICKTDDLRLCNGRLYEDADVGYFTFILEGLESDFSFDCNVY